ncbi:MAG TPA: hypothetical protein PKB14_24640 [Rubrivivax sp.]|nr:hypothetical protein [Rubrivivax sp.]
MNKSSCVLIAGAALLLQGCATNPATSQLLGERYFAANIDTYPLLIASVDGSSSTLRPQPVEPGTRRLVLRGPPGGAGFGEVQAFTLEVKPCTRYYLVAVKANPLDTQFTPRVDYEMPLGSSCRAPG